MKKLLFALLATYCFSAFSAALVKVDEAKKIITIQTNLVYYGKEASEANAKMCTQDIVNEWAPLSQSQYVSLGTKNNLLEGNYKIQLVVSYERMKDRKANSEINNRKKFENNYIEIPRDPMPDQMNAGGNVYGDGFTGSIYADGIKVPFKICAHEFGHLLGLGEMNSQTEPPTLMTQAGINTPFEAFQVKVYDPRFFAMSVGTFDVRLRKISNTEINEVKRLLQRLSFKDNSAVLNCNICF